MARSVGDSALFRGAVMAIPYSRERCRNGTPPRSVPAPHWDDAQAEAAPGSKRPLDLLAVPAPIIRETEFAAECAEGRR